MANLLLYIIKSEWNNKEFYNREQSGRAITLEIEMETKEEENRKKEEEEEKKQTEKWIITWDKRAIKVWRGNGSNRWGGKHMEGQIYRGGTDFQILLV